MATYVGTFSGRSNHQLHLVVNPGAQSIPGNYTYVVWELWVVRASGSGSWSYDAQGNWSINVGGYGYNGGGWNYDFRSATHKLLGNGAFNIPHNSDGTRWLDSAGWADSASTLGSAPASGGQGLATIPRASTASWNVQDTKYMGTTHQINTNRADGAFTHTLEYVFGTKSGVIATGVGASTNWLIPANLLDEIPNNASGTGIIRTTTFSGATQIGVTTSGITLTAPLTAVPTFTTVTHSEATAGVAANIGGYVRGISKFALAITGAAGVSGSTITSYKIEVAGQTINAASGTSTPIDASGTVAIKGTITDSRGRTATKTVNATVLAYAPPVFVTTPVVQRSLNTGVANDEGTYLRIDLNATVSSLIVTTQRNALNYRISTKPKTSSTWTVKTNTAAGSITFNSFINVGTYSVTEAYDVLVEVYDDFTTSAITFTVPVAKIFMHWDGSVGVGFGKYREDGTLDVRGDVVLREDPDTGETGTFYPALTGPGMVSDRIPHSGTTAQRDAYYGALTTTAQQVALANRAVTWYNTDKRWFESYYVVTGTSGLTAKGLISGHTIGWYPLPGSFLTCTRVKSNDFQSSPAGANTAPTLINPPLINVGGFTSSGNNVITPPFGGYYDVNAGVYWSGGGAGIYRAVMVEYVSGTFPSIVSGRFPNTGADGQMTVIAEGVLFPSGIGAALTAMNAVADNIYGDGQTRRTFLTLKYVGPPVVND